jgi:soluble lytic murein transglycosylase
MIRRLLIACTVAILSPPLKAQSVSLDSVELTLQAGASWHATRLLAPRLNSPEGRTPETIILAARAAGGWQGWATVQRLLAGQPWLDSRFDRIGHRLLAEAALANNRTAEALTRARAALPRTPYPRSEAESARRWVLLARTHERLTNWDSAGAAYTRAAGHSRDLGDWLALRAAGVTRDGTVRARLYSAVTIPAARARVGWTEAMALARFDQRDAAARAYAKLGAIGTSLRLRWEVTRDPAARSRIAAELLDLIRRGTPAAEARQALEIVEGYSVAITRSESLVVARRAAGLGRNSQAASWFAALARRGTFGADDRLAWGDALTALGRHTDAARTYRTITEGPLAGRAAYLAARADLRGGKGGAATTQLSRIPTHFPADTFAAGNALYLLGDLALDAGQMDSTRRLFRRLYTEYPSSEFAERGALLSPIIAYARGDLRGARDEFEKILAERRVVGLAADAARYWLARTYDGLSDREMSSAHYRALLALGPENYYAIKAANRLAVSPWSAPPAAADSVATLPTALQRAALLEELDLQAEARYELDHFAAEAVSVDEMLAAGRAFLQMGHASRATRMGQRALTAGAPRDRRSWQLVYPLPFQPALLSSTAAAGLDPWLVAALIRQESAFEPRATSAVGARGLMQMMPANGPTLARAIGLAEYDPALLWQPDVNLAMGSRHFAEALRRYPDRERALAAYNAGGTRVTRWSATLLTGRSATDPGFDPELFVERIPYLETRGYIRNITVNEAMYRLVYGSR